MGDIKSVTADLFVAQYYIEFTCLQHLCQPTQKQNFRPIISVFVPQMAHICSPKVALGGRRCSKLLATQKIA